MATVGFKTQAQREAELNEKENAKLNVQAEAPSVQAEGNVLPVHAATIDRINKTYEFICGEGFANIDSESKQRILSDFHYYSQVEAKLQLIGG